MPPASAMTTTRAETVSWTASRVAAVMKSVLDDLLLIHARGFLPLDRALKWHTDLSYLLEQGALEKFEVQLTPPGRARLGLHYRVVNGGLFSCDPSGSINLYWLPDGTTTTILLSYQWDCPRLAAVLAEMARRGWVSGGTYIDGAPQGAHRYGVDGIGLSRGAVGEWR